MKYLAVLMFFAKSVLAAQPAEIGVDLHRIKQAPPTYSPLVLTAQQRLSDAAPWAGFATVLGLNIADVETSQADRRACGDLCREGNPLTRSRWVGYGVGLPVDTLEFIWARNYHRYPRHGKSWIVPLVAGAAVHGFGTWYNLHSMVEVNRELATSGKRR